MAARNKPYEQFGSFLLFKKLESDALGELWRAGRIDGAQLGATFALRRLTGGNREALAAAVTNAQALLPQLNGTSFAKSQICGVIDGVPYLAHDYAGGRSLRHIIDRARGANGTTPNPLPIDQAIVIAEKVALSLTTTADLRDGGGNRLSHGALIPQFIWISDDGEIRVAGQQLGSGLVPSLADAKVAENIARYFSPEYRMNGTPSKSSEVWALGAILFLLVTGQEPPDAMTASAFAAAVRGAKTMSGTPIPDDIRVILDKSFNIDASMRYGAIADMKQALTQLANSGKYSATTFNLAFYLSSLLKKEMESEAVERDKESKVNVAPYVEVPKAAPAPAPVVAAAPAAHEVPVVAEPAARSKAPLAIAATFVIAAVGIGGWFMMKKAPSQQPAQQVAAASTIPIPQQKPAPAMPEPVLSTPATATTGTLDAEAQKKAFEEEVKKRMQAEMMKLQQEFTQQLKQTQSKQAPVQVAEVPTRSAEEQTALLAAQREAERRAAAAREEETPVTRTATQEAAPAALQQTQTAAPSLPQQTATTQTAAPAQQVREGDIVDVLSLDQVPRALEPIRPQYPPIAARQKVEGTVIVSALISESGEVVDVRVLRGLGSKGFGIDDAAKRAIRSTRYTAPMKDGKRVRTWLPQTIVFKP